jgi:SOS-response transcriptional repressor LexA
MSKQPFWDKVKSYLVEDLNQAWLSRVIGVPPSTVSMMIARNTIPRADTALKIADALGVSLHELLGISYSRHLSHDYHTEGVKEAYFEEVENEIATLLIPIIKTKIDFFPIQKITLEENLIGCVRIIKAMAKGFEKENLFAVNVSGDEMSGIHLEEDDIVVFVKGYIAGNGLYAVALRNEVSIKRLEFNELENRVSILSENPRYKTIESPIDNPQLSILGKVVGWTHIHL